MIPNRINRDSVQQSIGEYAEEQESFESRADIYRELIGFLPPRIEARFAVTGALDPAVVDLQEKIRVHCMYPKSFDTRMSQMILFGMLLMDGSDAAVLHAIAARRAGATWAEMQDIINLCFLFRGMSAANKGAEILANIANREEQAKAAAAATPEAKA